MFENKAQGFIAPSVIYIGSRIFSVWLEIDLFPINITLRRVL